MSIYGKVRLGCKTYALPILLACALIACERASERPLPPQPPPRPMASAWDPSLSMKKAMLTDGAPPIFHFQYGDDLSLKRQVGQT